MLAAEYGTVADIEVLWVLLAIAGASFAGWNFREARKDHKILQAAGITNGREDIAKISKIQSFLIFLVHLIFIIIGVLAATIPSAPNEGVSWNMYAVRVAITWGLISAAVILIVKSILIRNLRERVLRRDRHAAKAKIDAEKLRQSAGL